MFRRISIRFMGNRTTRLLGIFTAEQTSAVNEHRTRKKIGEKLSTRKTFCDSCTHYTKHFYSSNVGNENFSPLPQMHRDCTHCLLRCFYFWKSCETRPTLAHSCSMCRATIFTCWPTTKYASHNIQLPNIRIHTGSELLRRTPEV